ncbi:helicase, partial [Candidatus Bathyarchaeota archaeon]
TREWFKRTFKRFLEPQRYAIPRIKARRNVLIFSPTGSGKTLAAFLGILDELFNLAERNKLEDKVYCIYVSPLRALSNDIRKNLQIPLEGIRQVAKEMGYELPEIRIFVRHG